MVSREGFDTWLAYEWLFFKVLMAAAALVWIGQRLFGALDRSGVALSQVVVAGGVAVVCVSLGLAWWVGRRE